MNTTPTQQQIPENHVVRHLCGRCDNWLRLDDERLPDHGSCGHRPAGHYSHSLQTCVVCNGPGTVCFIPAAPAKFNEKAG